MASPLFLNYFLATENFKEICLFVIIENIQDIVASSTSILLSGSQKIKHNKKIMWSQHLSIRVFLLKKGVDDIDMVPVETH